MKEILDHVNFLDKQPYTLKYTSIPAVFEAYFNVPESRSIFFVPKNDPKIYTPSLCFLNTDGIEVHFLYNAGHELFIV